jgi:hypothetical protein
MCPHADFVLVARSNGSNLVPARRSVATFDTPARLLSNERAYRSFSDETPYNDFGARLAWGFIVGGATR